MSEATLEADPALLQRMLAAEKRRLVSDSITNEHAPRILIILVMAYIAWDQGNNLGVAIWALVMIFMPAPVMFSPRWYRSIPDRQFWVLQLFFGGVAYPIGWSLLPGLVLGASSEIHLSLAFIITALAVARSRITAYNPPEMYLQVTLGCGLLMVWLLLVKSEHGNALAFFLLILAGGMLGYGRAIHQGLVRMVTLNAQNLQLAQQLQQANDAKTRFLASASHDLRQPLHTLGLLVGLLNQRIEKDQNRAVVERIQGSLDAMEMLLNGILDISRLDAGVEQPAMGPVSVEQLCLHLERSFAADAARRGLRLRLRPSRLWVVSDARLLQRVLNNLVSNALRYTPHGGVLVSARARGQEVWLEVRDSGVGIAPEHLDRVFAEFVQLDNPHRDRTRGLGLGLAIVKRTADLLGHGLEVQSRPGHGSCFRLRLQRVAVPVLAPHAPEALADVNGLFVLVIDDEQEIRYAMQGLLSDWGCLVITARDADEALAVMEHRLRPPEAMLIDYRLPGGDGLQAARQLTEVLGAPTPTLIITGDVTAAPIKAIQDSGLPVLHKPVNPEALRRWLGEVKRQSIASMAVMGSPD